MGGGLSWCDFYFCVPVWPRFMFLVWFWGYFEGVTKDWVGSFGFGVLRSDGFLLE